MTPSQPPFTAIDYSLSFNQFGAHVLEVTLRFTANKNQQLWLPTWIPGSYLIREFARHIDRVAVQSPAHINIHKINKNTWQLDTTQSTLVTLSYQVYAFDLSVRGCYVDNTRIYLNPAAVCLAVAGQEQQPIQLQLKTPQAFHDATLACALPHTKVTPHYHLSAAHYQELIDHPLEIAQQTTAQFEAENIQHHIAISGKHNSNMARLTQDLTAICSTQIKFFGSAPFPHYLFMVMATANSYGGLEHSRCTSLITPRSDLPKIDEAAEPSKNYRQFLGLCSHEYFHAWLVKTIRPASFSPLDLHSEANTELLWLFEGFTSYYDDLMLKRAGVINSTTYLELLAEQITRFLQNPGRGIQSLHEASFDAWIKYYRPDENSANATTSYYNKGALVAMCLDLTLRQKGSSLDALMRALYAQAQQQVHVSRDSLQSVCRTLVSDPLTDFWSSFIDGVDTLPLFSLLKTVGVEGALSDKPWALGIKCSDAAQGLTVQQVLRHSTAAAAGLSAHDLIIAIDGLKATPALLTQHTNATTGQTVIHAFRRDELLVFHVDNGLCKMQSVSLSITDETLANTWLNGT